MKYDWLQLKCHCHPPIFGLWLVSQSVGRSVGRSVGMFMVAFVNLYCPIEQFSIEKPTLA